SAARRGWPAKRSAFSIPIRRCGWQAASTPNAGSSTTARCTHLLICCPQGLAREAQRFLNTYPAVWMAGRFDAERGI
ncbi:hypothetical protein CKQ90_35080, partial [Klebsiella pneumoniae]